MSSKFLKKPIRVATLRGVLAVFEQLLAGKPAAGPLQVGAPANRPLILRLLSWTVPYVRMKWSFIISRSLPQIR